MPCLELRGVSGDNRGIKHAEYRIAVENTVNTTGCMNRKTVTLAQRKKPADMIDVAIGQDDIMHRTASQAVLRLEKCISRNLHAYVRRAIHQAPRLAIERYSDACLGAPHHTRIARPCERTNSAAAIPLRHPAPGRRSQDHDFHGEGRAPAMGATPAGSAVRSRLGNSR